MNGTFLAGVRLAPNSPVHLQDGSTIRLAGDPPLTIHVAISERIDD
jgi:pSer/pThr/pTyr-binding forkhead associated (FHA) protein